MKKYLALLFLAIFTQYSHGDQSKQMDLDKPVTNDSLKAAMLALRTDKSNDAKDSLIYELNQANYLVPVVMDEFSTTEPDGSGVKYAEPGASIKVVNISDGKGGYVLPLFTDWVELKKFIDKPIDAVVFTPAQTWNWILNMGGHSGAVINPAENALPLSIGLVQFLSKQAQ